MSDFEKSLVAVVNEAEEPVGVAFLASSSGLFVTCTHVLEEAKVYNGEVYLKWVVDDIPIDHQKPFKAIVCAEYSTSTKASDVSILKASGFGKPYVNPLQLSSRHVEPDTGFIAFGFDAHNLVFGNPGAGKVTETGRHPETGAPMIIASSRPLTKGYSGSPCVLPSTTEVIGMFVGFHDVDKSGKGGEEVFLVPAPELAKICPLLSFALSPLAQELIALGQYALTTHRGFSCLSSSGSEDEPAYASPELERWDGKSWVHEASIGRHLALHGSAKNVVVVADAGMGKSRFVSELAGTAWDQPKSLGLENRFLPLLVRATSLASARGSSMYDRLAAALINEQAVTTVQEISGLTVKDLFTRQGVRILLLLDALDEVQAGERNHCIEFLTRTVGPELRKFGHFVIATSRPFQDQPGKSFANWQTLHLRGIDREKALEITDAVLGDEAGRFYTIATERSMWAQLRTPFLLLMGIRAFKSSGETFPENDTELYRTFIASLAATWSDDAGVVEHTLRTIACGEFENALGTNPAAGSGHTQAETALQRLFSRDLEQSGYPLASLQNAQQNLRRTISVSRLLAATPSGDLLWSHILFRDYLCALELAERVANTANICTFLPRIRQKCNDPAWREACLMFMVILSRHQDCPPAIKSLRSAAGMYSREDILLFGEAIVRGLRMSRDDLAEFFAAFRKYALEDADLFGPDECRTVFARRGPSCFIELLRYQRITVGKEAIQWVTSQAPARSFAAEWPRSLHARRLTPPVYKGPLCDLEESVYEHEEASLS